MFSHKAYQYIPCDHFYKLDVQKSGGNNFKFLVKSKHSKH